MVVMTGLGGTGARLVEVWRRLSERGELCIVSTDAIEHSGGIRAPRIDVRIDLENIFIGLVQHGWRPNLGEMMEAIHLALKDVGEIATVTGYADFDELNRHQGPNRNGQRELTLANAESGYVVKKQGKNTAEMKIADDIRTLVEHDPAIANIGLATMDPAFRLVVNTAQRCCKKLVVLGLKGALSHELESVASEVRYLDKFLKLASPSKQGSGTAAPPQRQDAALMMPALGSLEWLPLDAVRSLHRVTLAKEPKQYSHCREETPFGLVLLEDESTYDKRLFDSRTKLEARLLIRITGCLSSWSERPTLTVRSLRDVPLYPLIHLDFGSSKVARFADWDGYRDRSSNPSEQDGKRNGFDGILLSECPTISYRTSVPLVNDASDDWDILRFGSKSGVDTALARDGSTDGSTGGYASSSRGRKRQAPRSYLSKTLRKRRIEPSGVPDSISTSQDMARSIPTALGYTEVQAVSWRTARDALHAPLTGFPAVPAALTFARPC